MQFDDQADIYDKRTGLGEKTAQSIAASLDQMIQPHLAGQFLEIGAGTGEIGFFTKPTHSLCGDRPLCWHARCIP